MHTQLRLLHYQNSYNNSCGNILDDLLIIWHCVPLIYDRDRSTCVSKYQSERIERIVTADASVPCNEKALVQMHPCHESYECY